MSIQSIEVIGPGCAKCVSLDRVTRETAERLGIQCEIRKVDSMEEIIDRGVMATPALAIDGRVVASGRVLSSAEIERLIREAAR
jgi:small redox-active disulfide protein 2